MYFGNVYQSRINLLIAMIILRTQVITVNRKVSIIKTILSKKSNRLYYVEDVTFLTLYDHWPCFFSLVLLKVLIFLQVNRILRTKWTRQLIVAIFAAAIFNLQQISIKKNRFQLTYRNPLWEVIRIIFLPFFEKYLFIQFTQNMVIYNGEIFIRLF